MIRALTIAIVILIITQGCVNKTIEVETQENSFYSSQDTLIIKTEKRRGGGLFALGVGGSYFRNIADTFPYPVIVPTGIIEVERMELLTDFAATNKFYVDIIQGKINGDRVFIVDENNNKSLADDSVRVFRPIIWETEENLIKVKYTRQEQQETFEDSTWLRIGSLEDGGDLWWGNIEHLIGEFKIDTKTYQVGIIAAPAESFNYPTIEDSISSPWAPSLALISHGSIMKDTIGERDILQKGEIVQLGKLYYKYERVSNFGDSLVLVKENNFHELIGTQVGMIAPEFGGVTVSGDTIESRSLHDRTLVIVNSCGCGGDKESTEAYFDIAAEFGDEVHVIRMDDGIKKRKEGLQLDMNDEYNLDVYNKFRKTYCSRTCYTINTDNVVIDKFGVTEWEQYLPKLLSFRN